MTRLLLAAVIFLFVPAHATAAQAACARHREPEAAFSFCPPAGWETREVAGQQYKVHVGPRVGTNTPNLIVKDVDFDGTLDAFIKGNVDELERQSRSGALKSYALLSRAPFTTLAAQKGFKIVIRQEVAGTLIRQTFYAFNAGAGRKLIFTYSVLAEGGEREDKVFDESMKTLRLETRTTTTHPKNHR